MTNGKNWAIELLKLKGVVLVGRGKKITAGVNTGRDAMVVGVIKKVPLAELKKKDVVPKEVEGIETDVIELGRIRLL